MKRRISKEEVATKSFNEADDSIKSKKKKQNVSFSDDKQEISATTSDSSKKFNQDGKVKKNAKPSDGVQKKPFKGKRPMNKGDKGKAAADEESKPPDWAKFKKDKKELRATRRRAGFEEDIWEIVKKAKIVSDKLRSKISTEKERAEVTQSLHDMLKVNNYYKQFALAHDTTRIIQWLLKYSSFQIRDEISNSLMDLIPEMIVSKYARNCVKRILKYGSETTRENVINALYGNVVKFTSHAMSAPILDYIYNEIASKKQKIFLHQEFYGDMYKTNKDNNVSTLKDTYKDNPSLKTAMLGATKANILKVLNKNVHDCSLVHAVLYEYLLECNSNERSEIITTLSPLIAPLSNSKYGVKAAIMCVWHGTNKDKKIIIKVVKEHVASLATHEHGHLLILSILAGVDDTVLLHKAILSTVLKDIKSIAKEEWGRKIILWLVAPKDKMHFHPSFVEWLESGIAQGSSKKPFDLKSAELLKESIPSLCESVQKDTEFWLSSGHHSLTMTFILKAASGDLLRKSLDCISKYICEVPWFIYKDDKRINGIEHAGIHMSLKKLAQNDKVNQEKNEYTFGEAICKFLNEVAIESWIKTNRGCFLLITLFENNTVELQKSLKELLSSNEKLLTKQSTAGSKILLNKLRT